MLNVCRWTSYLILFIGLNAYAADCTIPQNAHVRVMSATLDELAGSYRVQVQLPRLQGLTCEQRDEFSIFKDAQSSIRVSSVKTGDVIHQLQAQTLTVRVNGSQTHISVGSISYLFRGIEFVIPQNAADPSEARFFGINQHYGLGRDPAVDFFPPNSP